MSNSAISGATWPLKINGQEFLASPLTNRDYDELDNYIQAKIIDVARPSLDGLSFEARSELLQAAVKAAASSGWGTPEGGKIIRTVEGMIRLGWQMIHKQHPRVSFDEFAKLVRRDESTVVEHLAEIDLVFGQLNLLGNSDDSEDAGESSSDTKSR